MTRSYLKNHHNSNNKPIQYQKGFVEFYKLKFKVAPDVLIPRPETELLVDEVLRFTRSSPQGPTFKVCPLTILDIGTGTGNIAISIAKNLRLHPKGAKVKIIATDISSKALKIAKQNAKLHGVEDRIKFIKSDLLSFCHSEHILFAQCRLREEYKLYPSLPAMPARQAGLITQDDNLIIVTNLPYIPSARIPYLDSSVKDFEPHLALDGGEDGFELYRKLFSQISQLRICTPGVQSKLHSWSAKLKLLIGEIDYTHGELAVNEALKFFPNAEVEVKTDLAHKQRILKVTF